MKEILLTPPPTGARYKAKVILFWLKFTSYPNIYEISILRNGIDITTENTLLLRASGRYEDITTGMNSIIDKNLSTNYQLSTYGIVSPWLKLEYNEIIEFDEIKGKIKTNYGTSSTAISIQLSLDGTNFTVVKNFRVVDLNDAVYKTLIP